MNSNHVYLKKFSHFLAEGQKVSDTIFHITKDFLIYPSGPSQGLKIWGGVLCVQMDFTRTFEANAKCTNINHVWSQYYKFLVVLKYHRRPWVNIFDTDISRCINTYIKVVYLTFFWIFTLLKMSVSKILAQGRLWYFKTTKIL